MASSTGRLEGKSPDMPKQQAKGFEEYGMCIFTPKQLELMDWATREIIISEMKKVISNL